MELRAEVPIPKGSEIFFSYQPSIHIRARRREQLKCYGFDCHCEMCALPDPLSDALDAKINMANDALEFVFKFLYGKEDDMCRCLSSLETLISITSEEGLLDEQTLLMPVIFILVFGRIEPLREVGQVVLSVFQRYWAPTSLVIKYLSGVLDNPQASPIWNHIKVPWISQSEADSDEFDARLQTMASNVVSSLRQLL
jgi:hypothetical protein